MRRARPRLAHASLLLALLLSAHTAIAEVVAEGGCPAGTDFEAAGFSIRSARISGPFMYLPWIRAKFAAAEPGIAAMAGQPYRVADIDRKSSELLNLDVLPDAREPRFAFSGVTTVLENCADQKLDVVFYVFSSRIDPLSSATFEARETEKVMPERTGGADRVNGRWRLLPSVGYGNAEGLFGGVSLEYQPVATALSSFLDSIRVAAIESGSMHLFSANLSGSKNPESGRIARAEWQVSGLDSLEPTGQSELRKKRLAGQVSAMTHPLGTWSLPIRFGGAVESGRLESDLHPLDVPESDYGSAKFYAGTTTRLGRHRLAASYGVELGSTDPAAQLDWIKHVGDVAHDFSTLVGDHRALEIESRLTVGHLQARGPVPVAARFFGGNREQPFVADESWVIRSNPVIRSLPVNHWNAPAFQSGDMRFAAYNLTATVPVWRQPIVPAEVSNDASLQDALSGQIESATTTIAASDYIPKSVHLRRAASRTGDLSTALTELGAAVTAAAEAHPGEAEELFSECADGIVAAVEAARAVEQAEDSDRFLVLDDLLLADEEGVLTTVESVCIAGLNAQINDPAIAAQGARVRQVRAEMERDFVLVEPLALKEAQKEMAVVKRTLDTIIHELNIVSVSPLIGLDVATIGVADSGSETRYGVGGGLRLTLVNSADFTAAYFANVRRRAGDPSGAFLFSLRFRDLLE